MLRQCYTYYFLIVMMLLSGWGGCCVHAQSGTDTYLEMEVQPKSFDDKSWQSLQEELDYSGKPRKPKKKKRDTSESRPTPSPAPSDGPTPDLSPLFKVLLFVVVIAMLGGLIFAFLQNTERNRSIQPSDIDADAEEDLTNLKRLEEELDRRNVSPYLLKAEQDQNYHLAVRLHFLALLKALNESGKIHWKKDRTNRFYLNQMRSTEEYPDFQKLTLIFEKVWYGNHFPNEIEYQAYSQQFESFNQSLNTTIS